ncbi:MAG: reverse transcriptase domain-containing protein [bacterium]|nr:reverse transcriptase domain-containing protein [bacterium]
MNTEYNQFKQDLFQAYYDARKNKRNKPSSLDFEINYERNLFELADEIWSGRYSPGASVCFIIEQPVKREIFAASFRDRIVHHLIYNYINPMLDPRFINDCYSCRIGKGTLYGIKRINHFIRSCSENYKKDCYILKLDIKGYFMSIDREILYNKVEGLKVLERELPPCLLINLIKKTIFYDPAKNCRINGKKSDWAGLPKSKSLFFAAPNKGLPIGNLTSQLFGNVYLNDFDHFIKGRLKCRYYGRYVDDIIIMHRDKEFLKSIIPEIRRYLFEKLGLNLHEKKIYLQHFSKGVKFLGAVIKPYRIYIANRTKGNFYAKIRKWNELLAAMNNKISKEQVKEIIACANSYLGLMKHYKTKKLRRKLFKSFSVYFWNYVYIEYDILKKRPC